MADADLATMFRIGQKAWPQLSLDEPAFGRFMRDRELDARLDDHGIIVDLFLACACLHQVRGAIEAFYRRFDDVIAAAASAFNSAPAFADEVKQRLAETLFVSTAAAPPRIAQYRGKGPLGGWILVSARRIALRLGRGDATRMPAEVRPTAATSSSNDPYLLTVRARYGSALGKMLTAVLGELPRRERLILKLHLVEGISLSRIAKMHGVSQPTMSRWVVKAQKDLVLRLRERVAKDLLVGQEDLESLVCALRSHLDFSIRRALDSSADEGRRPLGPGQDSS